MTRRAVIPFCRPLPAGAQRLPAPSDATQADRCAPGGL